MALTATASDADGTVAEVEYFQSGVSIGRASVPPYSVSWSNVPSGDYLVTATAKDNSGVTGTSASIRVVVASNLLPDVSLTSPAGTTTLREPATVVLSATATDSDGSISTLQFLMNDQVVESLPGGATSITRRDIAAGSYVVKARAIDNDGGVTTSSNSATLIVAANALPNITITSPEAGASFEVPVNVTISASASDPDGQVVHVEFFADGVSIGTATAAPYQVIWNNAPLGAHTISAKATDNDGANGVASPVAMSVNGITSRITSPLSGVQLVAPAAFDISATASTSASGITRIEFKDGPTLFHTANIPAGFQTASITVNLSSIAEGSHSYTATAFDTAGRAIASQPVVVNVGAPPVPPSVTLKDASGNQFHLSPAIVRLAAAATPGDSPIASVEFFSGTTLLHRADAAPYEFLWANVGDGSHTVTAKAIDQAGRSSTSPEILVVVASAPTITVAPGLNGAVVVEDTIAIEGVIQAPPNSAVDANGVLGRIHGNAFLISQLALKPGLNEVAVRVRSPDGHETSQTISVTRSGTPPFSVSIGGDSSVVPFDANVSIKQNGAIPIGSVELDTNGDGVPDYIATPAESAGVLWRVASAGVSTLQVKVKDGQGNTVYQISKRVVGVTPIDQAADLVAVHQSVMDRLSVGDIGRAINLFTPHIAEKYREIFTTLGIHLPNAVRQFGTVEEVMFAHDVGQLVVVRSTVEGPTAFMVTLVRGEDGIWRIDGM